MGNPTTLHSNRSGFRWILRDCRRPHAGEAELLGGCPVFLWLCGLFLIAAATGILLVFPEQLVAATATDQPPVPVPAPDGDGGRQGFVHQHAGGPTTIEGVEMIGEKYGKLIDIFSLPPVQALLLYLVTMQVPPTCSVAFRLSTS